MNIVRFPREKHSASAELRNSSLAKPVRRLEAKLVIDGPLAETITLGAGRAQITPDAFIIRALSAVFGGGHSA
jgi:hypothetical protein